MRHRGGGRGNGDPQTPQAPPRPGRVRSRRQPGRGGGGDCERKTPGAQEGRVEGGLRGLLGEPRGRGGVVPFPRGSGPGCPPLRSGGMWGQCTPGGAVNGGGGARGTPALE